MPPVTIRLYHHSVGINPVLVLVVLVQPTSSLGAPSPLDRPPRSPSLRPAATLIQLASIISHSKSGSLTPLRLSSFVIKRARSRSGGRGGRVQSRLPVTC